MLGSTIRNPEQIFKAQQHVDKMLFRGYHGEYVAEFVGTLVFVYVGLASNAQSILSLGTWSEGIQGPITWGIGLYFGTLVSMNISGGHLNPALTLINALFKKFSWQKVLHYFLAQFFGAFFAAILVQLQYYSALDTYSGGKLLVPPLQGSTAQIFTTFPIKQSSISQGSATVSLTSPSSLECFMDQFVGTMFFAFAYFALIDENGPFKKKHLPAGISLAMVAIGCSFGLNSNYAVNPARDFGPRLFCFLLGYGTDVLTAFNNYSIIPLIVPFIGALLGAGIYQVLISLQNQPEDKQKELQDE